MSVAKRSFDHSIEQLSERFLHRTRPFYQRQQLPGLDLLITIERPQKQRVFINEGVVEALAVNARMLDEILHGRSFVATLPEDLHRLLQRFILIELLMPSHLRRLL